MTAPDFAVANGAVYYHAQQGMICSIQASDGAALVFAEGQFGSHDRRFDHRLCPG